MDDKPDLNALLKPLLESKGFVDQKRFNELTGARSYENGYKKINWSKGDYVFITTRLNPADPDFLNQLNRWLDE